MARHVIYDSLQMIGYGAFNATFLVLAQRDFGWGKIEYSYHLTLVAVFTTIGAFIGATNFSARLSPIGKLVSCAVISGVALCVALMFNNFPMSSILIGICDGLGVLTMTVTRTRVQVIAKDHYLDFLSSILAARTIIIKAATLFGTGACLIIDDYLSLQATLILFVLPIGLSFIPFFITPSNKDLAPAPVKSPPKTKE
jgi:hypothetical protein